MLWSIKINIELDNCFLIYYRLVWTLLAIVDDNGHHFGHRCRWWTSPNLINLEVNINALLSTLI